MFIVIKLYTSLVHTEDAGCHLRSKKRLFINVLECLKSYSSNKSVIILIHKVHINKSIETIFLASLVEENTC